MILFINLLIYSSSFENQNRQEDSFDQFNHDDIFTNPYFSYKTKPNSKFDFNFIPNISYINVPSSFILSSSMDFTVKMWDTVIGAIHYTQKGNSNYTCIDIKGNQFITGSDDNKVRLQNVQISHPVLVFSGNQDTITQVKFSQDGMNILSASRDGSITIWSILTGEIVEILRLHLGPVLSLHVSENLMISGSNDGYAKVQDFNEKKEQWKIAGAEHTISAIKISRCENYVMIGGSEGYVQLAFFKSRQLIKKFENHTAPIVQVEFIQYTDNSINKVISVSRDGLILVYDFMQNKIVQRQNINQTITTAKVSLCGHYYIFGSIERKVILFNSFTQSQYDLDGHDGAISGVVAFSKNELNEQIQNDI